MQRHRLTQCLFFCASFLGACAGETVGTNTIDANSKSVVAAASKPPTTQFSRGYQIPLNKFHCKSDYKSVIEVKIINSNQYSLKDGGIGNYTVINDDLIFFQTAKLKGFFAQILNKDKIRLFKNDNEASISYICHTK